MIYTILFEEKKYKMVSYKSCAEASRILGIPNTHISEVTLGKRIHAGGMVFSKEGNFEELKKQAMFVATKGNVYCAEKQGEIYVLVKYNSLKDAHEKTGVHKSAICECLKGRRNKAGGRVFACYPDLTLLQRQEELDLINELN